MPTHPIATRLIAMITAMLAVFAASSLASAPAAQAAGPGSISGSVTGPGGQSLANISVVADRYDSGTNMWHYASFTLTHTDGTYTFDGLNSGTYRLAFRDPQGASAPSTSTT